jgi:hypothetical protein
MSSTAESMNNGQIFKRRSNVNKTHNKSGEKWLVAQAGGLVPDCDGGADDGYCDWGDLKQMIVRVLEFVILRLGPAIAAILFAYAGFLYLTSGANINNRSKATKIFKNVLLGYLLILLAWIIIATILINLCVGVDFILLEGLTPGSCPTQHSGF